MAETLLTVVNRGLTEIGIVQTALTALTSQDVQQDVDAFIGAVNECLDRLLELGVFPSNVTASTFTLVAGTRTYPSSFPADYTELASELMVDETYGQTLIPKQGGFEAIRAEQLIPANFTGLATTYAIDPTSGKFYLDASPTSAEAGRIYKYYYRESVDMVNSSPSGTFPVGDEQVRMMNAAFMQLFLKRRNPQRYSEKELNVALALAAGSLSTVPERKSYGPYARR